MVAEVSPDGTGQGLSGHGMPKYPTDRHDGVSAGVDEDDDRATGVEYHESREVLALTVLAVVFVDGRDVGSELLTRHHGKSEAGNTSHDLRSDVPRGANCVRLQDHQSAFVVGFLHSLVSILL